MQRRDRAGKEREEDVANKNRGRAGKERGEDAGKKNKGRRGWWATGERTR